LPYADATRPALTFVRETGKEARFHKEIPSKEGTGRPVSAAPRTNSTVRPDDETKSWVYLSHPQGVSS
jgi:hypothetical protein